jgi:hypothetical protein
MAKVISRGRNGAERPHTKSDNKQAENNNWQHVIRAQLGLRSTGTGPGRSPRSARRCRNLLVGRLIRATKKSILLICNYTDYVSFCCSTGELIVASSNEERSGRERAGEERVEKK